jgi:broad specificity phosphatase PhoE
MSEITFIRHAATDLAGTFCGHTDPPLNEEGLRQLAALQNQLRDHPIDLIYSSDLHRAYATALALAHNDAGRIITTPSLREIFFGDWEGLIWSEIERKDPAFAEQWLAQHSTLTPPNGEPYQHFRQRVIDALSRIEQAHPDQAILVVTHAGVMREILQQRCGLTPQQAREKTRAYCSTFTLARPA